MPAPLWPDVIVGGIVIDRPRVAERLATAMRGRRTVLSAPAGYGKTIAARQWALRDESRWTWITLHRDDDALRVAASVLIAAARLGAEIATAIPIWIPDRRDTLGPSFVDLASSALSTVGDATLVIDALDAPRHRSLVADLQRLVDHAPPNLHVLVTCRSRWPVAATHAVAAGVTVIGAQELAFTAYEISVLARDLGGRELSAAVVDAVLERTEGWPVALAAAAALLRGGAYPDELADAIRGDERTLSAYFHEEVLDRQPPILRRFLTRTAVLDRLEPSLCRLVTGEPAAASMLTALDHDGAFVEPVPDDGRAFAYHPLFRDVLRRELRVEAPALEADLLGRAAAWWLERDEPDEALTYLAAAERWDDVLRVLDRYGRSRFESGQAAWLLRWLDAVPAGSRQLRKDVAIRRAYALTMVGDSRSAEQALRAIDTGILSDSERIVIDALRATWTFNETPPESARDLADGVLTALDGDDVPALPDVLGLTAPRDLRMMAAGSLARTLWYLGQLDDSRALLDEIVARFDVYPPWRIRALGVLALLEAWAGNFRMADHHGRHALAEAERAGLTHHMATFDARAALAHVWRERGDLAGAARMLDEAEAILERVPQAVGIAICALERARWWLAAGDPDRGIDEVKAQRARAELPPQMVRNRLQALKVQLLVATGDVARAAFVVDAVPRPVPPELGAAAVQTAVAQGDLDLAGSRLDEWAPPPDDARCRLERELWTAIVDLERGNRRRALERAAAVIATARSEGHLRLFLDAGRPANRLLRAVLHAASMPYVRELVSIAEHEGAASTFGPAGLSRRELEIVRYLPTPLSSAEIAGQLYISLNTLKTHLRSVYRKLGVTGRREAVERAKELGLA